jgi:topoisomerase-4 subunit A
LAPGISADITIDALYKFTDCEVSISPNTCVIINNKPHFVSVQELLRISADNTKNLLQKELEIKLADCKTNGIILLWKKYFLKKKFIKSWRRKYETGIKLLRLLESLYPFIKQLKREVSREDILKLTEKPVRRIYRT